MSQPTQTPTKPNPSLLTRPRIGVRPTGQTLGGVEKARFLPTIPARRIKGEPGTTGNASVDVIPRQPKAPNLLGSGKKEQKKRETSKKFIPVKQAPDRVFLTGTGAKPQNDRGGRVIGVIGKNTFLSGPSRPFSYFDDEKAKRAEEDKSKGKQSVRYDDEPDLLDNGERSQYRPILLPFPGIQGEEVYSNVVSQMSNLKLEALESAPSSVQEASNKDITPATLLEILQSSDTCPLLFMQLPSHFPITPSHAQQQWGSIPNNPFSKPHPAHSSSSQMDLEENKALSETEKEKLQHVKVSKLFSQNADYTLKKVPPGLMGKLVIYKSGKVKLRVGDLLLEVSQGTTTLFHQELVSFDANRKEAHRLGSVERRLVCTLDVEHLLSKSSKNS